MTKRFGHKSRFAIDVGEFIGDTDASRRIDVWAAHVWLTCDDNNVNVTHFIGNLQYAVGSLLADPSARRVKRPDPKESLADNYRRLRADEDNSEYLAYRFMDWRPTADNVQMLLFREGGTPYIPFAFWRPEHHESTELGQVFVAELPEWELASVLHDAAWFLMWQWADRSRRRDSTGR